MTTSRSARRSILARCLAITLAALATSQASAVWEAADGEIFLSLGASVDADSNIASNSLELSDTIYRVTPGISWERDRGLGTISLSFSSEIERASEYDAYDSENYNAAFSLNMPATASGRLRGGLNLSYFDGSRVDQYQNTRIAETSVNAGLNGSYQVSAKLNARLGGNYAKTEPEELADYTNTSLSVGVGYNVRPDVSAYLDARFTDSSSGLIEGLGSESNTSGNAILVGLDGEITPKLTGQVGFGYDWSETETGGVVYEYTGPTYDISLTWSPREKTSLTLEGSNGIESTSTGGTDYTNVRLSLRQEIGLSTTANLGVNFRSSDFASETRGSDDVMSANIGATYRFNRYLSAGLTYTYTDSDSTTEFITYTRSVWSLSANARF